MLPQACPAARPGPLQPGAGNWPANRFCRRRRPGVSVAGPGPPVCRSDRHQRLIKLPGRPADPAAAWLCARVSASGTAASGWQPGGRGGRARRPSRRRRRRRLMTRSSDPGRPGGARARARLGRGGSCLPPVPVTERGAKIIMHATLAITDDITTY